MSFSYISMARPDESDTRAIKNDDAVMDAINNTVDYLNNTFNDHSHDFISWDYGSSGCYPAQYDEFNGDADYARDCIENLVDDGLMSPKENVVLPHGVLSWGYGLSIEHYYNGNVYFASCVYADSTFHVKEWAMRAMTWHEIGHSLSYGKGGEHGNGTHELVYEAGELKIDDITPMGTSYTYDKNGNVDTGYQGSADPPFSFCGGIFNEKYDFSAGDKKSNHDYSKYSSCTLDSIEVWMDKF